METTSTVDEIARVIGVSATARARGWLEYLVARRMKRAVEKARARREAGDFADVVPDEEAEKIIRIACAKAALTGALSGAVTTTSVVATAETEGVGGIVALPLAAAAVAGEMATRTVFHVDLACELAELFDVSVGNPADVARLLSVTFGRAVGKEVEDLGQSSIEDVTVDRESVVENAAQALVGESVLKNALPFVAVVSSAVMNVIVTRRIGRMLQHAFRYEREMVSAFRIAQNTCGSVIDLLIEGLWFVFTADGKLTAEETLCLAERLDDLDEETRRRVTARFTDDESDWLKRVEQGVIPESRESFLRVLEIAAALDKSLSLPEDKILRRAAAALHCTFEPGRVSRMIEQLEQRGGLSERSA